jgi:Protein of unknown function (DUF2971)
VLQECGSEKLKPALLRTATRLTNDFFETRLLRFLQDQKYIASFSLNATNPTMWGHYADVERGFVAVYESNDETIGVSSDLNILWGERPLQNGITEIGHYKDERLKLKRVHYGKKPPKVNAFHRLIRHFSYTEQESHYDVPLNLGGDAEEKKEHLIGLVKYSDWRYEREIRAFLPTHHFHTPEIRVLRFSLENFKGLVFGPKMSDENKDRAIAACHVMKQARKVEKGAENEVAFFQAKQIVDKFDFAIKPVGILAGSYFEGSLPIREFHQLDEATAKRLLETAKKISEKTKA